MTLNEVVSRDKLTRKIKDECDAWRFHCERLQILSRLKFQDWVAKTFTAKELAIFLEMDWDDDEPANAKRDYLHGVYLETLQGGV